MVTSQCLHSKSLNDGFKPSFRIASIIARSRERARDQTPTPRGPGAQVCEGRATPTKRQRGAPSHNMFELFRYESCTESIHKFIYMSNITSPCLLALFFIDSNQLADGFPLVKACPGACPPPGGCGVARAIPHVQRDVFVPVEIGSCGVQIRNDRSEV